MPKTVMKRKKRGTKGGSVDNKTRGGRTVSQKRKVKLPEYLKGIARVSGDYQAREFKWHVTNIASAIPNVDHQGLPLLTIPQGTSQEQRVGAKITITSIQCKGHIIWNGTTVTPGEIVKVVLVLDTQANGANALWTEVMDIQNVHSFVNLTNSHRFRILKEWKVVPTNSSFFTTNGTVDNFIKSAPTLIEWFGRLNVPIMYSGATGGIAEVRSNNLELFVISESNDVHDLAMRTRVRFEDS